MGDTTIIAATCLLAQALSHIPKPRFQHFVRELEADKGSKGFASWDQLTAMLFAQLAGAQSLREIEGGLACAGGRLNHLGLRRAPARSTLSYANKHRPWQLYEKTFYLVHDSVQKLSETFR